MAKGRCGWYAVAVIHASTNFTGGGKRHLWRPLRGRGDRELRKLAAYKQRPVLNASVSAMTSSELRKLELLSVCDFQLVARSTSAHYVPPFQKYCVKWFRSRRSTHSSLSLSRRTRRWLGRPNWCVKIVVKNLIKSLNAERSCPTEGESHVLCSCIHSVMSKLQRKCPEVADFMH